MELQEKEKQRKSNEKITEQIKMNYIREKLRKYGTLGILRNYRYNINGCIAVFYMNTLFRPHSQYCEYMNII